MSPASEDGVVSNAMTRYARSRHLEVTKSLGLDAGPDGYRTRHKLTWRDVHQIRRDLRGGKPRVDVATAFGINESTVRQISTRRTWKCTCADCEA